MLSLIIGVVLLLLGVGIKVSPEPEGKLGGSRAPRALAAMVLFMGGIVAVFFAVFITVPAGHVKVATLFGRVIPEPYQQGAHFPVNPLYSWNTFDVRQKTHKEENATVPSQDKLVTLIDLSVQYRIIAPEAPSILENTGTATSLIQVHMIPKLRSILREQGKSVEQAQDFFLESVQVQLQESLKEGLSSYLLDKGLLIDSVLIRDIQLPQVIVTSINATKQREQEIIKQRAELERFATEQEQKVKTATAERDAALLEAEKIRVLADAEAYKIEVINRYLSSSPQYVKLKAVEQWDGKLPLYNGGENMPIVDLRTYSGK